MQTQISLIYHFRQDMIVTLLAWQYHWLLHTTFYAGSNQLNLPGLLTLLARHDRNIISTTVPLTVTCCFLCMQVQISLIYQPSHCWQGMIVTLLAWQYHWLTYRFLCRFKSAWSTSPHMIITLLVWKCHWLLHAVFYAGKITLTSLAP